MSAVVHEKENSTKMVTVALILFLVQLAFMFVEYAVLAVMLAD